MEYVSIKYRVKWRLKDKPNYYWTECGKLINVNSGRVIKKTLKGLTPGYWVSKNFIPLTKLKSYIELIPKEKLPF